MTKINFEITGQLLPVEEEITKLHPKFQQEVREKGLVPVEFWFRHDAHFQDKKGLPKLRYIGTDIRRIYALGQESAHVIGKLESNYVTWESPADWETVET